MIRQILNYFWFVFYVKSGSFVMVQHLKYWAAGDLETIYLGMIMKSHLVHTAYDAPSPLCSHDKNKLHQIAYILHMIIKTK